MTTLADERVDKVSGDRGRLSWVDFPAGPVIGVLLAALVFAAIWLPELAHWYVNPPAITDAALAQARKSPQQSVLDEVAAMGLGPVAIDSMQVVAYAEKLMHGSLSLPGFASVPMMLPFSPDNLERGLPAVQLMVASLVSADIFMEAYRVTAREEFLRQARDVIIGFAQFEAARWVDHGLMWNDHAIAARIPVLVKFWAAYRVHLEYDPLVGRTVLDLVARSASLLLKPSFYGWRTDHGIMADLAVLQIAAAFSELPGISELRDVAAGRFSLHLSYWINQEGVTLLHSAGYHNSALRLFGIALRLHTLNHLQIPKEWWDRYEKAVDFYRLLRRPDGSLPMYGDTMSTSQEAWPALTSRRAGLGVAEPLRDRPTLSPTRAISIYPVAGHAIIWDDVGPAGAAKSMSAQTAMTWSNHPGLGHKLADELSLILWASGRTWLTSAGYWPYGVAGREQAESWEASNAPHLLGESKHSARSSRVRAWGQGDGIAFVDVERVGPLDYSVRRQLVRLADSNTWVVLDHSLDSSAQSRSTHWTFYPDLSVTPLAQAGRFWVGAANSPAGMVCTLSGSGGFTTQLTSGQSNPLAGWVVLDRTPTRAPVIVVQQDSRDSWSLATFVLADAHQAKAAGGGARMDKWVDAEHWTAVVPTASSVLSLTRTAGRLEVQRQGSPVGVVIDLGQREAPEADIGRVRKAVFEASTTYHQFRQLKPERLGVSQLLLAALAAQELLLFMMRQRLRRAARALRVASWLGWASGGLWLSQVYFIVHP
jgi:hypothetical protein